MDKILWIDDKPDEEIGAEHVPAEDILSTVYKDCAYEFIIETDPIHAIKMIAEDRDIKLVLLDTYWSLEFHVDVTQDSDQITLT